MKPLLNRLVFHGIQTCRDLLDPTAVRVRPSAECIVSFHALATTALERVTADLGVAGFVRKSRIADRETWMYRDGVRITISPATVDKPDSPDAIAREYAVLLTRAITLGDHTAIRVSGIASQLAMYWCAYNASGARLTESEWIEDIIELVVQRREIVDEVGSAPIELRTIIARAAANFVVNRSARWVLRRALPDARQVPSFVECAHVKFVRLAALCDLQ